MCYPQFKGSLNFLRTGSPHMITDKRKKEIEASVRSLHLEVLQGGRLRTSGGQPHLIEQLSPDVAIEKCGFSYDVRSTMPSSLSGAKTETAGMIDFLRQIVIIKGGNSTEIQRFTAGHELGHLVLHRDQIGSMPHRDRPLPGGEMGPRSPMDEEADFFSALYTAPGPTVIHFFQQRFGKAPLPLNDLTAYHIAGEKGRTDLLAGGGDAKAFAVAVARAEKFGGHDRFHSLAKLFCMSPTAMGFRLRELGLVVY